MASTTCVHRLFSLLVVSVWDDDDELLATTQLAARDGGTVELPEISNDDDASEDR